MLLPILPQDPSDPTRDNERENSNILNAILTFPLRYEFHVVGRTDHDTAIQETFVQEIQDIVRSHQQHSIVQLEEEEDGDNYHDHVMEVWITPRGKFTKVTIKTQMESAENIAKVYQALQNHERSVMNF
jgi:putative lipoic acid-binding regulatory protein